jgi:hypothetical protein
MVAADTFVYFSQQGISIFDGDAPLEYTGYTSFIKFVSYDCIRFGATHDAP